MRSLCNEWEYTPEWYDGFAFGVGEGKPVRLPHTVAELPLHYADHTAYQGICGYRRKLDLGQDLAGKHIFLQFDGAAHIASVFLNGKEHREPGNTPLRTRHRLPDLRRIVPGGLAGCAGKELY